METYLKLKSFSGFFIAFLKSTLISSIFFKKNQSQSLPITEIINCETGSYLNVQKAIFLATLRKTTCERIPITAEISTERISYHFPISLR